MATKRKSVTNTQDNSTPRHSACAGIEELLLSAISRGDETLQTGRYLISYEEGGLDEGIKMLKKHHFDLADARDFTNQALDLNSIADAEALVFPEVGVALVGGDAIEAHGLNINSDFLSLDSVRIVEPEYFAFTESAEFIRGFASAANAIARDYQDASSSVSSENEFNTKGAGATWGLVACGVSQSSRSGEGIKVAVLDTGMDLGHLDFANRRIISETFVGQPVQDLNGHGTHCVGTACGPLAPSGQTPRYGIAYASNIYVGKVLSNSGSGTGASVIAGMNWAIANRCEIISMSLGSQSPVQAAYTNAGAAALRNGLLIIAAAGNAASGTGAPANSPTIMSVSSLDPNLQPSSFSNFGKIEIAAPGRDVFSSWPRPTRYRSISGTSMAAPHVAGCAALWAQSSASLRGANLWRQLTSSAHRLPLPASRVGAGIVQAS